MTNFPDRRHDPLMRHIVDEGWLSPASARAERRVRDWLRQEARAIAAEARIRMRTVRDAATEMAAIGLPLEAALRELAPRRHP